MSHIFKKKYKNYFQLFKLIILILIISLFYLGFQNFLGNKLNYISFSIISNFLIFFAFRKNALFFETFFSLFLWLGFWFKFTVIISLTDGLFREGVGLFNYSPYSFNKTLLISQIGILAFILAGYFREFFLFNYPKKIDLKFSKYNFFKFGKKKIWISFFIFFLIIGISNFYFGIYQKGMIPNIEINFFVSGSLKWLLLFGLSSISATLIFSEINYSKKFLLFSCLLIYLETFVSSFSMLSRGMIFNSLAIFFGIYKFSNKVNIPNDLTFYIRSLLFIFILFYISVSSVNYIRANFFYEGKSVEFVQNKKDLKFNKEEKLKFNFFNKNNSEILYLLINRWVGIDGVMAVISKENLLSVNLFKEALKEKPIINKPTFYELNFELESMNSSNQQYSNVKGNTLPGIIAFLFYFGSFYTLFIIIFIISIISSMIEYISFKLSSQNMIFSGLIGQVVAFRFIHFGYLPSQSYLLFGSILLTISLIYCLNFFLNSKKTS